MAYIESGYLWSSKESQSMTYRGRTLCSYVQGRSLNKCFALSLIFLIPLLTSCSVTFSSSTSGASAGTEQKQTTQQKEGTQGNASISVAPAHYEVKDISGKVIGSFSTPSVSASSGTTTTTEQASQQQEKAFAQAASEAASKATNSIFWILIAIAMYFVLTDGLPLIKSLLKIGV